MLVFCNKLIYELQLHVFAIVSDTILYSLRWSYLQLKQTNVQKTNCILYIQKLHALF